MLDQDGTLSCTWSHLAELQLSRNCRRLGQQERPDIYSNQPPNLFGDAFAQYFIRVVQHNSPTSLSELQVLYVLSPVGLLVIWSETGVVGVFWCDAAE